MQQGHITKHGDWWVLRFRESRMVNGELRRVHRKVRLAKTESKAGKRIPPQVRQLSQQILQQFTNMKVEPAKVVKVEDFVESIYLPHIEANYRASTMKSYKSVWNTYLKARCSKLWLRDVRTFNIQQVLNEVARQHDVSRNTLHHVKALLSGIFSFAKQQGYFDGANPVEDTTVPKNSSPKISAEPYAYSLEEIAQFLVLVPEPAATVVALAAFTGLRRGEIRGLLWENYTGKELYVTRSIWNSIADEPKTRKSKAPVPVIEALRKILDAYRLRCGNPPSGPIFRNNSGNPMCLNNLRNRLVLPALQTCLHCGKPKQRHKKELHVFQLNSSRPCWNGWHAFRRGLATNLNRLGVPGKTIQAILRHSNLSTTMNIYVKSVDEDSVHAMAKLQDALAPICAPIQGENPKYRPN